MAYRPQPYPRQLHPHQTLDGRLRVVKNHFEETVATGIPMREDGRPVDSPEGPSEAELASEAASVYKPIPYPRAVRDQQGRSVIVKNHREEHAVTGIKMNEDGTPVMEAPAPAPPAPPAPMPSVSADVPKKDPLAEVVQPGPVVETGPSEAPVSPAQDPLFDDEPEKVGA